MGNPFFNAAELAERERLRRLGAEHVEFSIPWFVGTKTPVYLFGAGRLAETVLDRFSGMNVQGIMDNNRDLQGTVKFGLPVYAPEEAFARNRDAVVIAAMHYYAGIPEVVAQSRRLGFGAISWYTCEFFSDPVKYGENLEERPGVREALDLWEDARSREVYRSMIRYRASFDPASLPVDPGRSRQYFVDMIPEGAFRHFADLGAYDGDTLVEFLGYTRNRYESYYAFEPDRANAVRLRYASQHDPRVVIFDAAVSDYSGVARMNLDGMASAIAGDGKDEVRCVTLDGSLGDMPVSLVKMDVEGAEPAALRGAVGLIRKQRPVLQICVYHSLEHLWEIPLWIRDLDLGYRLHLMHHCDYWHYDTVCYAIPSA